MLYSSLLISFGPIVGEFRARYVQRGLTGRTVAVPSDFGLELSDSTPVLSNSLKSVEGSIEGKFMCILIFLFVYIDCEQYAMILYIPALHCVQKPFNETPSRFAWGISEVSLGRYTLEVYLLQMPLLVTQFS